MYHELSINNFNYKSWGETFPDFKVSLKKLLNNQNHQTWKDFFEQEFEKEKSLERIEKYLSHALKVKAVGTDGIDGAVSKLNVYPYPDLVFNAFSSTPLDKIKVVILGQDPYHQNEMHGGKLIPQAMGLSFSVPKGMVIPSSLKNIFGNIIKFGPMDKMPPHGNLSFWAYQGCLMLNTALTVQHGHANSHADYWEKFTDNVIKYISKEKENLVFLLWGSPALSKLKLIDEKKHKVIISSHPSGLSCNNKLKNYSAFVNEDHFSKANEYLKKHNKQEIVWKIV